ncbi:homolog of yeast STE14 A [Striga asiatica]|uniref:Homolog of yeast STE14 A n=1 Tax=Striga asiatica TaxID=4170 RepID=A0A5A7PYB9_STRAF|nr:homolog of yeast STE14 A [Striga asiatica]
MGDPDELTRTRCSSDELQRNFPSIDADHFISMKFLFLHGPRCIFLSLADFLAASQTTRITAFMCSAFAILNSSWNPNSTTNFTCLLLDFVLTSTSMPIIIPKTIITFKPIIRKSQPLMMIINTYGRDASRPIKTSKQPHHLLISHGLHLVQKITAIIA